MRRALLLLVVGVAIGAIVAGGAGATTTTGARKQSAIVLALTGTSSWSQSTDTLRGTFTGTVGARNVSGTYAGSLTLGTNVPCTFMSAIQCWLDVSGSLTFAFAGKEGSFRATVAPGGRAGWSGTAQRREYDFLADLNVVGGTGKYAGARGRFGLSYSSVTAYDSQGLVDQHDSGTLQGSVR